MKSIVVTAVILSGSLMSSRVRAQLISPPAQGYKAEWYKGSRWQNDSLRSGPTSAFFYSYTKDDDFLTADDEYSETLEFAIDSSFNSFVITDSNLKTLNPRWKQYCYCSNCADTVAIHEGRITGRKITPSRWHLTCHLIVRALRDQNRICSTIDIDTDFQLHQP